MTLAGVLHKTGNGMLLKWVPLGLGMCLELCWWHDDNSSLHMPERWQAFTSDC